MASFFKQKPFAVLDGGLATALERKGADLNHPLWSAKVLKDSPELIFDSHFEFMQAGADIILTSTYQASVNGFKEYGLYDREARETIFSSIMLAVYAREKFIEHEKQRNIEDSQVVPRPVLIGGSCGPYGAVLANGAEYTASYIDQKNGTIEKSISAALVDYYQSKIEILLAPRKNFKCDFLAFETLPSAIEAQIIAAIMKKYPGARYWFTFSNPQEALKAAEQQKANPQLIGFGLNCVSPSAAIEALPSLKTLVTQMSAQPALVVYPNSGQAYDSVSKKWMAATGSESLSWAQFAQKASLLGANVIGGCCQTSAEEIAAIASARE